MEALIRLAGMDDLERLVILAKVCFSEGWGEQALAGALVARDARAWLVFGDAGSAAPPSGFVLARRIVDLLEIDLVGVAPDARRQGLASRLLTALIEAERCAGLAEVRLELSALNAPAAQLYAGLGFVVVGRRPRYYPDGSDALLLSRFVVSESA